MAYFVKICILLNLFPYLLSSDFLEHQNILKYDFGNNQFSLPIILAIHVSTLTCDIVDTVVICNSQLLQVPQKLVSLRL
jgi:hypothetical protein